MRKYTYLAAGAAAAALLAAVSTGSALAAGGDELTAGGNNVNVGDTVSASLSSTSAVLSTSIGKITCTASTFSATDTTNPAEGVAEATETLHVLSFSGCTSTISGTTGVRSVGLTSGTTPLATVVDEPSDNPIDLDLTPSVTVVLNTILGPISCIYAGPVVGVVSNAAGTITFTSQSVSRQTGSSVACPSTGSYSATYGNVDDTSMTGSPAVIVN